MDQNIKKQVVERLKQANNILVTVSNDPSVDQLAACIGTTLLLNKLDKHATAVFSGQVPSTIGFLKPEETIEDNTDSLRDFIISLDKAKADKLRYKVEDQFVKIFITPYRYSLSDKDLEFSHGDFNVDAILAIGVHKREELDQAIMAHGRIFHDATVISVTNNTESEIGAINWNEQSVSSLSEMLVELSQSLDKQALDQQIATAFLTGIVAETDRFSNDKTSPRTMTLAGTLLQAGANQQLIASELEAAEAREHEPSAAETDEHGPPKERSDEMTIQHEEEADAENAESPKPPVNEIDIDPHGNLRMKGGQPEPQDMIPMPEKLGDTEERTQNPGLQSEQHDGAQRPPGGMRLEPPTMGFKPSRPLKADDLNELFAPSSLPPINSAPVNGEFTDEPAVPSPFDDSASHFQTPQDEPAPMPQQPAPPQQDTSPEPSVPAFEPPSVPLAPPPPPQSQDDRPTLSDLEQELHSPHAEQAQGGAPVDAAQRAVDEALALQPRPEVLDPEKAIESNPAVLGPQMPVPSYEPQPAPMPENTAPETQSNTEYTEAGAGFVQPQSPANMFGSLPTSMTSAQSTDQQPFPPPAPAGNGENFDPQPINPFAPPVQPNPAETGGPGEQPAGQQPGQIVPNTPPPIPPPMMPPNFGPPPGL